MISLMASFSNFVNHKIRDWLLANVGSEIKAVSGNLATGVNWTIRPVLGQVNCVEILLHHEYDAMMFKLTFGELLRVDTNEK